MKQYTYDEIKTILDGKSTGRNKGTEYNVRQAYVAYRKDPETKKYRSYISPRVREFFEAYAKVKQPQSTQPIKTNSEIEGNHLDALDTAFANLHEAVANVISKEVEERTKETIEKKDKEIEDMKEDMKQKAKMSNWRYMLQKKWKES